MHSLITMEGCIQNYRLTMKSAVTDSVIHRLFSRRWPITMQKQRSTTNKVMEFTEASIFSPIFMKRVPKSMVGLNLDSRPSPSKIPLSQRFNSIQSQPKCSYFCAKVLKIPH